MRKEATIVIDRPGRDAGKVFKLHELPAEQAESWGLRLMLALSRAGIEVPEGFMTMGMAGVAVMGLRAMGGLSWDVAKPMLDEMMTCVRIQPGNNPAVVRALIADDIEEVATRVLLREEIITLHTGFSIREFVLNLKKLQEVERIREETESGEDTETSPSQLDELSLVGSLP